VTIVISDSQYKSALTQTNFLPEQSGVCTNCGRPVPPQLISCPECGLFQPHASYPTNLPAYFQERQVSVSALKQSGLPSAETTYLALGGGLGSFAWADYLRICGAAANQITVVGTDPVPYARFRRLCLASQILDAERIRSDSSARPDNVWGWPGYALQEIVELMGQKRLLAAARIAWQIFGEPTMAHTYAPTAQTVYTAVDREMKRIGWRQMVQTGEICAVRQTDDGRYVVVFLPSAAGTPRFIIAPYLHLALGYPGVCLTPEAQNYRRTYHDIRRVVQGYETQEHIYEQLQQSGGTVILRGRGVVASRILQHLDEIRQMSGQPVEVIHLLRSPVTEKTVYGKTSRLLHHHRQVQPFNWPKATFGGELRTVMEKATPEERLELAALWGGTTTSDRPDWLEVVERGQKEGWYSFAFGTVTEIKPNGRNRLILKLQNDESAVAGGRLVADFMFDCTGLNTAPSSNPILGDLACRYGIEQNAAGGWLVSPDFEIKGLRNGGGQVFAAGITAAGNTYAPVDSFLGLQYAAQRAVNVLIQEKAPNLHLLTPLESLEQWWRWVNGREPSTV
jgi:pSer/pThr/pTyr-binding forkhead associated (FHA) protein